MIHRIHRHIPMGTQTSGVGMTQSQSLGVGAAILIAGAVASTIAWRSGFMAAAVIIGLGTVFGAPLGASKAYTGEA